MAVVDAPPVTSLRPPAVLERPRTALASPAPAATTRTRDRFVDAVRTFGTLSVLTVHWLMPEATWDGMDLRIGNALGHGAAWVLTWVLQVLPLLFFAAGASAAFRAARHPAGGLARAWPRVVAGRVRALAVPVLAFVGTWVAAALLLPVLGVPDDAVAQAARIAPQLLWFLAVDVMLFALAPALLAAYRRWGRAFVAGVIALPLAVDLLRFAAGADRLAWANLVAVWAVPYVLGIAYALARRTGASVRRGVLWAGLGAGLAGLVALVSLGPYPPSMIGMPGDAISNLGPPTAPVVALALAQVCAVLLLRERLLAWTAAGRGAAALAWVGARSMTLYLWHLTAMFVVVGVVLVGAGSQLPSSWSLEWWLSRPGWFGAFALVLGGLVAVFGRFEGSRGARPERGPRAALVENRRA
ncbi:conserved hypothetical protein [Beutenbergia cavernae DSM 12333]|uniref:Acyltransferase 3 domain-containing protein n=1 Tax=Beutenbergia cavernae (strain ATCC BAA-8 / DSM 12333 / CCUG 43141 / JCM 11478 / NBRC 16432 / NCIMB 13614 / HKI 0122) TaxID=471853 RepID=C5C2D1_BEUC1|nr:acyltransferase family protein [Beutenbergia cavernae]ACQ79617.1 conserved hypothetical protein [Beutenbergia cavernae DSM 12333]